MFHLTYCESTLPDNNLSVRVPLVYTKVLPTMLCMCIKCLEIRMNHEQPKHTNADYCWQIMSCETVNAVVTK